MVIGKLAAPARTPRYSDPALPMCTNDEWHWRPPVMKRMPRSEGLRHEIGPGLADLEQASHSSE